MAQDAPSRKRARTTSDEQPTADASETHSSPSVPGNLQRHEEFWFHDGNIILIARNTAFRVYQGLLSAQSTIFQDMFSSSTSRPDEVYEGCPTVRLSDSPEELSHFLRMLFPKSQRRLYRSPDEPAFSFDQIFAITRLAHKYGVEDLQKQALFVLQEYYFTTDFDRWEVDHVGAVKLETIHAIGVVNLARLTDTPTMLPVGLYMCCSLEGSLLDGWCREDDQVEHIYIEDTKRCLDARGKLAQEAFTLVAKIFLPTASETCLRKPSCTLILHVIFGQAVKHDTAGSATVLESWKSFIRDMAAASGLCSPCTHELLQRDVQERRALWDRLPEIFSIEVPGWGSDAPTAQ